MADAASQELYPSSCDVRTCFSASNNYGFTQYHILCVFASPSLIFTTSWGLPLAGFFKNVTPTNGKVLHVWSNYLRQILQCSLFIQEDRRTTDHSVWNNSVITYSIMFELTAIQLVTLMLHLWFRWQPWEKEWHGSSLFLFCHWLQLNIWSSWCVDCLTYQSSCLEEL